MRRKYREVSISAVGKFKYPTGRDGAVLLGYDAEILAEMPEDLLSAFCGVGNPFSLGEVPQDGAILDIGCGAGFDLIVARRKAGEGSRVCGVDLTAEMVERARRNFSALAIDDVETQQVEGEELPFEDGTFDLVISNGVINLSPAKDKLFREIHRVLRPGGRLQFADMVLEKELPPHLAASLEAWSQ